MCHIFNVNQLVTKHLNIHDRLGQRESFVFVVSKQNLNLLIGASNALKISKNRMKLKK
jgi:hypothetical protein